MFSTDGKAGNRSQYTTNNSQTEILDDLAKTVNVSNKQRNVADSLFKVMNSQHGTGINVISQLFTDPGQKTLTAAEEKKIRDYFFAPNCVTFGDVKQVISAYGLRRHDNRENLLFGFVWDDHSYSLQDAVNNFISKPLNKQLSNLINDALAGDSSTKVYYATYLK